MPSKWEELWQPYIKHREYDALEECTRFIHRTAQGVVVVHIELLVLLDVFPDRIKEHDAEEQLRLRRLHAGYKYPGCS